MRITVEVYKEYSRTMCNLQKQTKGAIVIDRFTPSTCCNQDDAEATCQRFNIDQH